MTNCYPNIYDITYYFNIQNTNKVQWWTLEEHQKLQEFRLQKIVTYVYKILATAKNLFSQCVLLISNLFIGFSHVNHCYHQIPKGALALMLGKIKIWEE